LARPPRALRDFGADGDPVSPVVEPQNRQQDHLLELPKRFAVRHFPYIAA
jgi:hypothetical protein